MSKQSEALKLADLLCGIDVGGLKNAWLNKAAAELRRLHHENELLQQKLAEAESEAQTIADEQAWRYGDDPARWIAPWGAADAAKEATND